MIRTRHIEILIEPRNKSGSQIKSSSFYINEKKLAKIRNQIFIKFQIEKQVSSEPNVCNLEIYDLSDQHSSALDFKYDLNNNIFGPFITINGGYLEDGIKTMFKGVIVQAITVFEAPNYITRIQCQNIAKETNKKWVEYQVSGSGAMSKADVIIAIIKQVGGKIESSEELYIRTELGADIYKKDEVIKGRFGTIMSIFNKTLERKIFVNWDDAGVTFTPPGIAAIGRITKIIKEENGLINAPKVSQRGVDCDIRLNGDYRISDPVIIQSKTTSRLKLAADNSLKVFDPTQYTAPGAIASQKSAILYSGKMVVTKIIHTGDNRDGDFKTSISSTFADLRTI